MMKIAAQIRLHRTRITSPFPDPQAPFITPETTLLFYPINISGVFVTLRKADLRLFLLSPHLAAHE